MYSNDETVVTPTPQPGSPFVGSAFVNAKILYFGGDAFAYCNGSAASGGAGGASVFKSALESVKGVYGVMGPLRDNDFYFKLNASAFAAPSFNASDNASENNSENFSAVNASELNVSGANESVEPIESIDSVESVDSAVSRVAELTASLCGDGSAVLRRAGLQLEDGEIMFQSLSAMNDSRSLSAQDVSSAFRSRMRSVEVEGFVVAGGASGAGGAGSAVNATVPVSITVRFDGTALNSYDPFPAQIEQVRYSKKLVEQILGATG